MILSTLGYYQTIFSAHDRHVGPANVEKTSLYSYLVNPLAGLGAEYNVVAKMMMSVGHFVAMTNNEK